MIECHGVPPPGIALGDTVRVFFANGEQDVGYAGEMNWRHKDDGYNIVRCDVISRYADTPEAAQQQKEAP
jgi:hypothetical protein